jgi:hypothetical protein
MAGGTTSTGALQQVSGVGTAGQVLTSNGAEALPEWKPATPAQASLTQYYVGVGDASNQLSGSSSLTFNAAIFSVNNGLGAVRTGYLTMPEAVSIGTPPAGSNYIYMKPDNMVYIKDDTGVDRPIGSNNVNYFVANIVSPGGFALNPVSGLGNGMYMYEVTISIMNQAGTVANTYKYDVSFRFASGAFVWTRVTEVYKNESNANVGLDPLDPILFTDEGTTCRFSADIVYSSGSYSNVNFAVDAKRIAYKPE